jgi:hypothetical protein
MFARWVVGHLGWATLYCGQLYCGQSFARSSALRKELILLRDPKHH